jgi:isoamylase
MRNQKPGSPTPLGATYISNGWWNFAVYSPHIITELVIGDYETGKKKESFNLDPAIDRTGDIWHISIQALEKTLLWGWKVDGHLSTQATRIAPIVADPFAKLVKTTNHWGNNSWSSLTEDEGALICVASSSDDFSWSSEAHVPLKPDPLIIYETHVRGFTKHPSSAVAFPGTFQGMIEKLPHLKELGITAVELLPIYEFDESEWQLHNPVTGKRLYNYWGYSPLNFFSPMQRYGTTGDPLETARELKALVQACHERGIAVILDVVYNHTGEGNEHGPAFSFKTLATSTYYIMNSDDTFANYSGCGNTLNANHPVVIDLIINSLRHWMIEYRIDGFRFDLASALTRSQKGIPMSEPSLIESIIKDPVISKGTLITEPWDAAGLYQTGALLRLNQCRQPMLMEWNDRFRDDARRFIKGTKGFSGLFASRFCGSEDIYGPDGTPENSINYIAAHDGFSLQDIVSYTSKHNIENGEHNRDGMNENFSWNCGIEGTTDKHEILRLRDRQVKNFLVALFMSQGIPMILMGDECKRSKLGNNNTWCQDSLVSWLNWDEVREENALSLLISTLNILRSESGCFHQDRFLTSDDVQWHGTILSTPRWDADNHLVACTLYDKPLSLRLYIAFNASSHEQTVEIPHVHNGAWHCIVNTSKTPPLDIFRIHEGPRVQSQTSKMIPYSCLVLYRD